MRSFPSSPSRASRVLFLAQFVCRLALEKPVEEAVISRFDFQPLFEKGVRARGLEQGPDLRIRATQQAQIVFMMNYNIFNPIFHRFL